MFSCSSRMPRVRGEIGSEKIFEDKNKRISLLPLPRTGKSMGQLKLFLGNLIGCGGEEISRYLVMTFGIWDFRCSKDNPKPSSKNTKTMNGQR